MKFDPSLRRGTLIRRYKRFLADIRLEDGTEVTAHCANTGAMTGLTQPGAEVWLSESNNPKRKLRYSWELIRADGALVGVNTANPNRIVREAIETGAIAELTGYESLRPEVKYGTGSRIDILLEGAGAPCYVEIKNVHLKRGDAAEFPDAKTARGAKHMEELARVVAGGARAVVFYLVQRGDCARFRLAEDIDPAYGAATRASLAAGVEALCYACHVSERAIMVDRPVPIDL